MGKKPKGRMINVDISLSQKVGTLSPHALSLFCMLIPHFDSHGKMLANPHLIKGLVCPLVEWMTPEIIHASLIEISDKTNVKFWKDEKGLYYLQSMNWKDHQDLREDRLGPDYLPDYSGITPGLVGETPAEVKGSKGKEEVEVEGEKTKGRFVPPSPEEVKAYCDERNRGVDPQRWFDHYSAKGWMIGKNKMKDWRAAVRTWEKNNADVDDPDDAAEAFRIRMLGGHRSVR